jgi:hypothetical protein
MGIAPLALDWIAARSQHCAVYVQAKQRALSGALRLGCLARKPQGKIARYVELLRPFRVGTIRTGLHEASATLRLSGVIEG